jgi:hypothetical protein
MSRKLTFSVTLTFESAINDDNDILEIAKNIARAIKSEADTGQGITTDFSDTYTEKVEVKPQFIDETITLDIV